QQLTHLARLRLQRLRPLADGGERGYHMVREHPLAIEAAPPRGAAVVRHQLLRGGRREALMDREDVANIRVAGVFARDPGGVGRGGLGLLPDRLRRVEEAYRVAEALRHLGLAVEPEATLRRGRERLRLREREPSAGSEAGVPATRDLGPEAALRNLVHPRRQER